MFNLKIVILSGEKSKLWKYKYSGNINIVYLYKISKQAELSRMSTDVINFNEQGVTRHEFRYNLFMRSEMLWSQRGHIQVF
jgi:hypothetical protein